MLTNGYTTDSISRILKINLADVVTIKDYQTYAFVTIKDKAYVMKNSEKEPRPIFSDKSKEVDTEKIKAIIFKHQANNKISKPIEPIFEQSYSAEMISAVDYAKKNFPEIMNEDWEEDLKRKVKQLLPLDSNRILSWGNSTISNISNYNAKVSDYIAKNMNINCDVIEDTIKYISGKRSVIQRLFYDEFDLKGSKKQLNKLRATLAKHLQVCEDFLKERRDCKKDIDRLFVALVCAKNVSNYDDSNNIIQNRSAFFQTVVQQSNLIEANINQFINVITINIEQIDQLLLVAIPAFKLANKHE